MVHQQLKVDFTIEHSSKGVKTLVTNKTQQCLFRTPLCFLYVKPMGMRYNKKNSNIVSEIYII